MSELRPELKAWIKQEKCKYNSIYVIPAQRVEDKFRQLQSEIDRVKVKTLTDLRDAIQPDGLINSDAGTKTIRAITNAINKIITQKQS